MLLTIITFLAVLSVLVLAHEFGHYWTARKVGVRPEEFGIGFPPRAVGFYKGKDGKWKKVAGGKAVSDAADTIWSINWLPLGGFVRLGEDEEKSDDPNHFVNKKIWQRAVVMVAGVTMNIILAAALISFGFMVGLPQEVEGLGPSAQVSNRQIQILEAEPGSPAEAAGLKMGDIILGINGEPVVFYDELTKINNSHIGQELTYKIKRGGEELAFNITPELRSETGKGGIGIAVAETGIVKYPWYLAIWEGVKNTVALTIVIVVAFYELLKGIFIGNGVSADVAGPVGIAALTGQVARMGFAYLIHFTALLSINLAILNAFPFPALDGGRLLFLLIEKIKGSPVRRNIEAIIHYIGFALLMLLVLLVTFRDLLKYIDFAVIWQNINV